MGPRVRGLLYLLFVAAFLVSAPVVVLYTAGYRFSLDRFSLVKTGLVSVSTVPRGATVLLDGKAERYETPVLVNNVLPGEHTVEIVKDGYASWKKTLAVNENETTFVQKIVLFFEGRTEAFMEGALVDAQLHAESGRFTYAREESGSVEIWSEQLPERSKTLLLRLPQTQTTRLSLSWSPHGNYLLVTEAGEESRSTVLSDDGAVRLAFPETFENADAAFAFRPGERVTDVSFDPLSEADLFVQTTSRTFAVALPSGDIRTVIDESVATMAGRNGTIIAKKTGDRVTVSRLEGDAEQTLAYVPDGLYRFLPAPDGLILLHDPDDSRLVLLDGSGADRPILLNVEAAHASWSPVDAKKLLYATDFEIHVYDAATHTDELITRLSRNVQSLSWHPVGTSVLYGEAHAVYAIELDRRDGRNVFLLADLDELTDMWVTRDGKRLYLLGRAGETSGLLERTLQER